MTADWRSEFKKVWDRGVAAWKAGRRSPKKMFSAEDAAFLANIGCTSQEFFDFVDDHLRDGDFDFDTVLAVTGIRSIFSRSDGWEANRTNCSHEQAASQIRYD